MQNKPDKISMQDALKLANSPAGQQLLALLKSTGGQSVEQARQQASKGDFEQARITLSKVLSSPDVQKLLRQMEQQNG